MNKSELINRLLELTSNYTLQELRAMHKDELEELLEEHTDESSMFPNGRDTDSEDEDF